MATGNPPGRPRKDIVALEQQSKSFLQSDLEMKELKKVLKEVSKQSRPAIDKLVMLLSSTDETMVYKAATKLLEMQVELSKTISNDQLQRLIAEIKLNNANRQLVEVDQDKRQYPKVDFNNVQTLDLD